jgi:hypothetical protein
MRSKIQVLIITAFLVCLQHTIAQQRIQLLYNFCTDSSRLISVNGSVYADHDFFIAAGNTASPGITTNNCYLATFDYGLNLLHKKELYFPGLYNSLSSTQTIIKVDSDKYLFAGVEQDVHSSVRTLVYQPFFFFFNRNLDSLGYAKYTDTIRWRSPQSLIQNKQKNIIVASLATSSTMTYDSWSQKWFYDSAYCSVSKYDKNANVVWEKSILSSSKYAKPNKIVLGHDSNSYFISGLFYNYQSGFLNTFIIKTDTSGNTVWKNTYNVNINTEMMDLIKLKRTGYAFLTTFSDSIVSNTAFKVNMYFGKINEEGDTLWTKQTKSIFPGANYGAQINEAPNGDLLVLGTYDSVLPHSVLFRTDSNGNIKWYRKYEHVNDAGVSQQINSFSLTDSNRLLLGGAISFPDVDSAIYHKVGLLSWFVLTDTFGCMAEGCQVLDTIWHTAIPGVSRLMGQVWVYPNPAQGTVHIKTGATGSLEAVLTDMNGKTLQIHPLAENNTETIPLQQLIPGNYLLQLLRDGQLVKMYKLSHY